MSEGTPSNPERLRRLLAASTPSLEDAPRRIRRFRIREELGRGAMGIVYRAEDPELGREVALKILDPARASTVELRARFLREARAAAALRHPNIATVHEADEDLLVMELVRGRPLSEVGHDLDLRDRVRILRDAARAVHAAHQAGFVHRDLKPGNLLLEGERVVVTDFGVAKALDLGASLTLPGHLVGTPSYMAPEQARGHQHAVDQRSDVYGLGATLFDLLCGRPPFVADELPALLARIQNDEPPRARKLAPKVPRALEVVLERALAQEREQRYQSAEAFADDLERWLEGEAIHARPLRIAHRLRRFLGRHRLATSALLLLLATLTALQLERSRRRGVEDALEVSGVVEAALDDSRRHLARGNPEAAGARLDEGINRCRRLLSRRDLPQAWLLLARLQHRKGRLPEAKESLRRALRTEAIPAALLLRGVLRAEELRQEWNTRSCTLPPPEAVAKDPSLARRRVEALADLDHADIRKDRLRDTEVLLARALRSWLRGEAREARESFRSLQRLDPLNCEAQLGLLRLDLEAGDGDQAWMRAFTVLDFQSGFAPAYPGGIPATDPVARVANRHALSEAERRIQAGDRSPAAFRERASARLLLDDALGALADFSVALQANPDDALAHANRGAVRTREGAKQARDGREAKSLELLALAIEDANHALVLRPEFPGARNNRAVARLERARIHHRSGRPLAARRDREAARADLDALITRDPAFGAARTNRVLWALATAEAGRAAGEATRPTRAIARGLADLRALEREEGPGPEVHAARSRLLELEARGADSERAPALLRASLVSCEAALSEASPEAPLLWRCARLNAELRDFDAARRYRRRALAAAPSATLRERIERLSRSWPTAR